MKAQALFLITLLLFSFNNTYLIGQEALTASGGNAEGIGGSVSFTIGQSAFNVFSGSNGSIVQGVQQPYEISIVTDIESPIEITFSCLIYPNPTKNLIKLSIVSAEFDNMNWGDATIKKPSG